MANPFTSHAAADIERFNRHHDRQADYWTRTVGVPWEQLSRAVQAVSDRAAATAYRPSRNDAPPEPDSHLP